MAYGSVPPYPAVPAPPSYPPMPVWDPAAGQRGPYGHGGPTWAPSAFVLPPAQPRPRPATAASWALTASIVAVLLAPCLGGAIPAVIALGLARMAATEVATSSGWLTGAGMIRAARVLSLVALSIAVVVGTAIAVSWLVGLGVSAHDPHYPSNVN